MDLTVIEQKKLSVTTTRMFKIGIKKDGAEHVIFVRVQTIENMDPETNTGLMEHKGYVLPHSLPLTGGEIVLIEEYAMFLNHDCIKYNR